MRNTVTAAEALNNARLNGHRDWNRSSSSSARGENPQDASNRIYDGYATLVAEPPHRTMPLNAPLFAMGSCFAREIESALIKEGGNVISQDGTIQIPAFSRIAGKVETGFLHRFTPQAMLLEFQRAFGEAAGWQEDTLLVRDGDRWFDMNYFETGDLMDHSLEAVRTRRLVATNLVKKAVHADIVVLTLGLTESFRHRPTNFHVNRVLPKQLVKNRDDFEFHNCTMDEAVQALESIRDLLLRHRGRDFEMVVTVSPVPLASTFTAKDIIVANMDSKATLRAAAACFCDGRPGVHYFPSYEMVMYSNPELAWRPDRVHINKPMVSHIVSTFMRTFMQPAGALSVDGLAPLSPIDA